MTKFSYFIVEYAQDGFTSVSIPFLVVLIDTTGDKTYVRSFFLSDWRARLQIKDSSDATYIRDFLADVRQLNHMTETDKLGFIDLISGFSADMLRTTADGVCELPDNTLVSHADNEHAEQVACSSEEFEDLLTLLQAFA